MKIETTRHWRRLGRRRRWTIAAVVVTILLVATAVATYFLRQREPQAQAPKRTVTNSALPPVSVPLNLPPPDLLRPITPEEALKENAERAFSGRPDTPAAGFMLKADQASRDRALECMTQAIYYEAATEGADGQRAVAQIVLNRMRHPAYPSTVCGVIYQGSQRPTGCQFTFTCDGSLARVPVPSLWKQAQRVATEALGGKVFGPVGHATHYHADYVLPYWADSLDKAFKVGRHIFYRLKGGLGSSGAFRQRYGGVEPLPPPPATVEVALEAVANAGPMLTAPTNVAQASAGDLIANTKPQPELVADALKGSLLIDGDAPPPERPSAARPRNADTCAGSGSTKLRPMSANDARAQQGVSGC